MMKKKPGKVYEHVYIHAAKISIAEGWALMINSMDAYSEFAFEPVLNATPLITIDVLNQLLDNILKGYKPIIHLRQICFCYQPVPRIQPAFIANQSGAPPVCT